MNFYPIYRNKKLLPWIKWWLIKGNKVMPKHLSEWINSASAITLTGVYKGSPLLYLSLNGNTSQTGTPKPEAPVPVNVVKGNNTITINDTDYQVNLKSKNLLSLDTVQYDLSNQYYKDYGTGIKITENMVGKIYSLSYKIQVSNYSGTATSFYSVIGRSTNNTGMQNQIKAINNTLNTTEIMNCKIETITIPNNVGEFLILRFSGFSSQVTGTFSVSDIQLEEASQPTPYEPYYDYELCKIGDYQDVIYKEANKWYVDKYINKVTFNGTETWKRTQVSAGNSYAFWNQYTNLNIPVGKFGQKYCDYFEYQEKIWEQSTPNHLAENNTYTSDLSILFNVDSSIATTLTEWNTWLSNHNTTVYYALATSTTTEITETNLINQLEAIYNCKLNSGTNTITQTPSDLPFYLNFRYYEKG